MSKFKNKKTNKSQGIHTIFGQHSVKAAIQMKRESKLSL